MRVPTDGRKEVVDDEAECDDDPRLADWPLTKTSSSSSSNAVSIDESDEPEPRRSMSAGTMCCDDGCVYEVLLAEEVSGGVARQSDSIEG